MDGYAELRAALDAGPTPGPWRHTTYMSGTQNVEFPGARGVTFVDEVLDADARAICSDNDTKPFPWLDISHRPEDSGDDRDPQRTRNARYTAASNPAVILALLAERDAMKATLEEALMWHESQDKAISKQPNANTGHKGWMRLEHQERAALIRAALAQEQGG